jgi:surface polysaccharide O-acyltransferase-like enzyme
MKDVSGVMMKKRNSSLELLRIVSMILIVAHHYVVHGGVYTSTNNPTNELIVQFLLYGGKLGVMIFIIITGYFLIDSSFSFKRLVRLYLQVIFYSITLTILFTYIQVPYVPVVSLKDFYQLFFPVVYQPYWFFTSYAVLFLFTPAINAIIKNLDNKNVLFYLGISFLFFTLLPTFLSKNIAFDHTSRFMFYYSIGAIIKRFEKSIPGHALIYSLLAILVYVGTIVYIHGTDGNVGQWSGLDSFAMIMTGLLSVIGAIKVSFHSSILNWVASTTFGVYLLHDNIYLRPYIWRYLLKVNEHSLAPDLTQRALLAILVVFLSCVVLDSIRMLTIGKIMDFFITLADKVVQKTGQWLKRFLQKN